MTFTWREHGQASVGPDKILHIYTNRKWFK